MKITTWNVNGMRAALGRGSLNWLTDWQPDVLCLQEIKTRPDQYNAEHAQAHEGVLGYYEGCWHPAEKPGYSGVATFARWPPNEVQIGLSEARFDREGRAVITRHNDFLLFNIYFPNGQRDHNRLQYKLDFYAYLLELCDRLHAAGEQVVICGDFNTAHREIDLKNPRQNANNSGFLPEERAWIDRYLEHGLGDAFRALYPDRVAYTWWTYIGGARGRNVGWRLDYFLVSASLLPRVQDVIIHDDILGSDHCPVTLVIDDQPPASA